jgi:hypothetical protein
MNAQPCIDELQIKPSASAIGSGSPSAWSLLLHSLVIVLFAVGLLSLCRGIYFDGLKASDGVSYATTARNYSEGHGLLSSVILPGLIDVVSTERSGQPFVLQAPLWPILLGEWFKIFGSSIEMMHVFSGLLCVIAAVESWWLGYFMSRRIAVGYIAALLFMSNAWCVSSAQQGLNAPLQCAITGAIFLSLFWRPTIGIVIGTGILVGLATLTRENGIFCMAAVAICWFAAFKAKTGANSLREFLSDKTQVFYLVLALATALAIAGGLAFLESARKADVIGRWDAPTLRLTFLYETSADSKSWLYQFQPEVFKIDPTQFFLHHPKELVQKMYHMIKVGFVQQTLPTWISQAGFLLPVVFPWFFRETKGRWVAFGLLLTISCQLLFGSMSFLHFTYFLTYLPVLCPVIATTAFELWRKVNWPKWTYMAPLSAGLAVYALLPIPYNYVSLLSGRADLGGDFRNLSVSQERKLFEFVERNTSETEIVAMYPHTLVSWYTHRTTMLYGGAPEFRISDSDMWKQIDARVGIDAIVLTSLLNENPSMKLPAGFELACSLNEPEIQAWLFRRIPARP